MHKIKQLLKANQLLLTNFGYLSALQVFNLVLPLLAYPYLIRVLSAEIFGQVVFAQAVASYFGILVNFGFNISAVKNVSENRNNALKLNEIASSVLSIKTLLWLGSFLLLILLVFTIPGLYKLKWLYIFSFGLVFNELLFPAWYFQGIEKMKYVTLVNLAARSLFVLCIFIFIKNQDQYLLVPVFNGVGAILGGLIALFILIKKEKVKLSFQPWVTLKFYFIETLPLFYSRLTALISERINIIFIGNFLGMTEVTYYDFAIKILNVFKIPFDLLVQTVYPRIALNKDTRLAKKQLFISVGYGTIAALMLFLLSGSIAKIVGGQELLPAQGLLQYIAPLVLVYAISYSLGQPFLLAFGFVREFSRLVIFANLLFLASLVLLWLTQNITVVNCILLLLLSEIVSAILRLKIVYQKNLLNA